jgi:uncharacterized protein YecT (DUF1311 family)
MKKLIFILLLLFPIIIFAQEESKKQHPIDKWLDDCMAKPDGQSTMGMVECTNQAYEKWDKELNKVYKELMNNLPSDEQKVLKDAQKAWLKYRDEEFKLLDKLYSHKEGTMYLPMHAYSRLAIIRERSLKLADHVDLLNEK